MEKAYTILCERLTDVMIAQEFFSLKITNENITCGMSSRGILYPSKLESQITFSIVAYKGKIIDIPYEKAI